MPQLGISPGILSYRDWCFGVSLEPFIGNFLFMFCPLTSVLLYFLYYITSIGWCPTFLWIILKRQSTLWRYWSLATYQCCPRLFEFSHRRYWKFPKMSHFFGFCFFSLLFQSFSVSSPGHFSRSAVFLFHFFFLFVVFFRYITVFPPVILSLPSHHSATAQPVNKAVAQTKLRNFVSRKFGAMSNRFLFVVAGVFLVFWLAVLCPSRCLRGYLRAPRYRLRRKKLNHALDHTPLTLMGHFQVFNGLRLGFFWWSFLSMSISATLAPHPLSLE